jgi:predicted nucleic acid-binding protein
VTHPGIFKNPLSPSEAMQNLHYLINHQDVEILSHDQKSWSIFHRLQEELHIRGNLTADAQTAAILEANGIRKIFTTDSDFMKFSYLHPINPFK